jgi:hypothetical protein
MRGVAKLPESLQGPEEFAALRVLIDSFCQRVIPRPPASPRCSLMLADIPRSALPSSRFRPFTSPPSWIKQRASFSRLLFARSQNPQRIHNHNCTPQQCRRQEAAAMVRKVSSTCGMALNYRPKMMRVHSFRCIAYLLIFNV